ncbi:MAG TPA: hypothetical protein VIU12_14440 [Chryseolinea sp.]
MEKNEKTIEVLNDLIRINNDRIEGYKKASANTHIAEADLKTLFLMQSNTTAHIRKLHR